MGNMNFLVLAACVAVSASALVTYPNGYAAPLVGYANGAVVPADTVEVAAAKAEFAAAGGVINAPAYAAAYAYGAYPYAYGAFPYGVPLVAHPNGAVVPAEPIEVVEARAAHLKALAEA